MTLAVYFDDRFLAHDPPPGEFELEWSGRLAEPEPHPDRPERVENVRAIVESELASRHEVTWPDVREVTDEALYRVHKPTYVTEFREFCETGGGRLTPETGASEESYEAARCAAGAAVQAAEAACTDPVTSYALVRPSGHHAQPAQADGFCFFNNVAVAAEHALAEGLADDVAVVDWDVHHGNGTQEAFYDRDDVLYVSLHTDYRSWDDDARPQAGTPEEAGVRDGAGYTLNCPLPAGAGDDAYAYAFDALVAPVVADYEPDLLLVSAGQDAGTVDPLGRGLVTKPGFEALGERARELADDHAGGSLALVQEGGYQVSHLAYATLGVLEGALGVEATLADPFAWLTEHPEQVTETVDDLAARFADDHGWPTG